MWTVDKIRVTLSESHKCISIVFANEIFLSVPQSVRLSASGVVSKRLNLSSIFLHHMIAQLASFVRLIGVKKF